MSECRRCTLCEHRVDEIGHLVDPQKRLESATWDWFNLEMLPMDVGDCRGCREVKTRVLTSWLNLLVLLDVLWPRPNWDMERKKKHK